MAELKIYDPKVIIQGTLVLDEEEMRALDALTGYDIEAFIAMFYSQMGRGYMKPHEAGLRRLFAHIRATVPGVLRQAHKARLAFNEK